MYTPIYNTLYSKPSLQYNPQLHQPSGHRSPSVKVSPAHPVNHQAGQQGSRREPWRPHIETSSRPRRVNGDDNQSPTASDGLDPAWRKCEPGVWTTFRYRGEPQMVFLAFFSLLGWKQMLIELVRWPQPTVFPVETILTTTLDSWLYDWSGLIVPW